MLKIRTPVIILAMAFVLLSVSPLWSQDTKPKHAPNALPGVEPEMLTPDYWIALQDDADEVVMTPEEIERFNERVRNKTVVFRDYYGKPDPMIPFFDFMTGNGLVMNPLLPLDLPDTLPGDSLRIRLKRNIDKLYFPESLWGSRDFYDGRNALYNDTMKQEIINKMNINGIPDVITRRFGIIVNHTNARYYPTSVPGYHNTESELDRFQAGGLYIGEPVAILHESLDGDFLYIESPVSRVWVAARDVAIDKRETIRTLTQSKNFLMAAVNKVPVYGDPSFSNFERFFYFSGTMPLITHTSAGYVVKMPYRMPDGSLGLANGYIKPDADVHIGYFPYTKGNMIKQIFKILNTPYGWEDQDNKRDCCGTMYALLRCFGIKTGRWVNFILLASDHRTYIDPELSVEQKLEEVAKIEPIITMAGASGHIVLFLGKAKNGKLYYMHQVGWGYEDENGDHLTVKRVTINDAQNSLYNINSPKVYTTFRN